MPDTIEEELLKAVERRTETIMREKQIQERMRVEGVKARESERR